jgi:hypothetical protein
MTPSPLYFKNSDMPEEVTEEASHDTIEHMASFLTLRVGMAMLRRQLKKQKESESPLVDAEQERHSLLHKKEGDRNLALGDEFDGGSSEAAEAEATTMVRNSNMPSCIATDFGKPLDVLQENINPMQVPLAKIVQKEESEDSATATAVVEVESSPAAEVSMPEAPIKTANVVDAAAESEVILPSSVVPAAIATDFGKPLDVLQEGIPPLHGSFASAVDAAASEVMIPPPIVPTAIEEDSKDSSAPVLELESPPAEVSMAPTNSVADVDAAVSEVMPPVVVPTVVATDSGKPLDVLQEDITPLDDTFAQVQPEELKETDSAPVIEVESPVADVSIAPTDTDSAVDAAVPRVIIPPPPVEPTPVTTKKSNYLPTSKGKKWGPISTVDSPVSSSTTDTVSKARAALADTSTASVSGALAATVTNSAANNDLIAKYFVYPSDTAPAAVQAKPSTSWKESMTFGGKSRDTSGLQMAKGGSTVLEAPMETKEFDAFELITQQSFQEQIRYDNVDMAKAKRADENLELSAVESKWAAMAAGAEVKLDTKDTSKKAEKKKQNNKTKPATGFGKAKPALGKKQGPSSTASSPASKSSTTDAASTPTLASSGDSHVVFSQSIVTPQALDSLVVETKKASSEEAKQRALLMARLQQERRQKEKLVETKKALFEEAKHRGLLMARLEQERRQKEKVVEIKKASSEESKHRGLLMARLEQERRQRETPDRQSAVTLARKQPKSPEEEKRLRERYGAMLLGQRAHAILYDLGMIEKNLDPADPDYDHSNDNEVFL